MAEESSKVANDLLDVLSTLKVSENSGKRDAVLAAIKTVWKTEKVNEVKASLKDIREQLQFHVIVSMKHKVDVLALRQSEHLLSIEESKRKIVGAILDSNQDTQTAISKAADLIISRLDTTAWQTTPVHDIHQIVLRHLYSRLRNTSYRQNISHRQRTITVPHGTTFDWIFEDVGTVSRSESKILQWLSTGNGIFWITGKAGSGKSVLLKFIANDGRTNQALRSWAGDNKLVVAQFYFWRGGTDSQRSESNIDSLFRSIFVTTLSEHPQLLSVLFPRQDRLGVEWADFPSLDELTQAFHNLATQTLVKVVLFVDGLDEYEGSSTEMTELVELFNTTTSTSNIKIIASSRPVQLYEVAFEGYPTIRLHEFTDNDIAEYVDGQLTQNPLMLQLALDEGCGTQELIKEIVSSASGVFLWVVIVVGSLLEGLQSDDSISQLQGRLREFPRQLDDLFGHMLTKVPDRYREQSSHLFQIIRRYDFDMFPLSTLVIAHAESHNGVTKGNFPGGIPLNGAPSATANGTGAAHESAANEAGVGAVNAPLDSPGEVQRRLWEKTSAPIARRLRIRCAGLIEIRHRKSKYPLLPWEDPTEVHYLHRLVKEYLERPSVWEKITKPTQGTNFDADIAMLKAAVGILEIWTPGGLYSRSTGLMNKLFVWILDISRNISQSSMYALMQHMDNIDQAMHFHSHAYRLKYRHFHLQPDSYFGNTHWSSVLHGGFNHQEKLGIRWEKTQELSHHYTSFLDFAAQTGQYTYVQAKLGQDRCSTTNGTMPLLYFAVCRKDNHISEDFGMLDQRLVKLLLQKGADPNEECEPISPWRHLLYRMHTEEDTSAMKAGLQIMALFADHGANPHAFTMGELPTDSGGYPSGPSDWYYSAFFVIRQLLGPYLPLEKCGVKVRHARVEFKHILEHDEDLRAAGQKLVNYMRERGARAEAWCRVSSQDVPLWVRVYPPSKRLVGMLKPMRGWKGEDYFHLA